MDRPFLAVKSRNRLKGLRVYYYFFQGVTLDIDAFVFRIYFDILLIRHFLKELNVYVSFKRYVKKKNIKNLMKILLSVRKKGTGKEQLYLLIKQSFNNISLYSD